MFDICALQRMNATKSFRNFKCCVCCTNVCSSNAADKGSASEIHQRFRLVVIPEAFLLKLAELRRSRIANNCRSFIKSRRSTYTNDRSRLREKAVKFLDV